MKNMSKTQKMTFSAMVVAIYVVIMFFTQSFAFGAYQIRIATAMYALSYLFPFLVIPLGLSNLLSNMVMGGMGIFDIVGGCIVGMVTSGLIVQIRRLNLNKWLMILPIILVPGLGVATWLSYILNMPYSALALSLCIGQITPAICGVILVKALEKVLYPKNTIKGEN